MLFGLAAMAQASEQAAGHDPLDVQLSAVIAQQGLVPIHSETVANDELVALGRALFFDKILSGSRDIACATCHHPKHHAGDDLSLSIGVGGSGLGYRRSLGEARRLIPRNAPEIFNRGNAQWRTMFWDGRVEIHPDGSRISPAREKLPAMLDNVVAMQAMFPVTSRNEMRGRKGDLDIDGQPNPVAAVADHDFETMWDTVMTRILAIPEYARWFKRVYPEVPSEALHFAHAANALAAFQIDAFAFDDSPWDRYLAGNKGVLSTEAKRGAALFFGRASCASCHGGELLTDQDYYNILVPQIGPGHRDSSGFDIGRARVTDKKEDAFAFRTPPLRNVAITGPWMHNGTYKSLQAVIEHHVNPLDGLQNYDVSNLDPELARTFRNNPTSMLIMTQTFSPKINLVPELSQQEIDQLIAFLQALTSPASQDLEQMVPESVPSGLPVNE